MADTTKVKWQKRVDGWRASGRTSIAFSSGRDFTAGGLRHWAHRLRKEARSPVRFARVKRVPAQAASSGVVAPPRPAILVEVGAARVSIGADFDRATLAAVLEVLGLRDLGGAR